MRHSEKKPFQYVSPFEVVNYPNAVHFGSLFTCDWANESTLLLINHFVVSIRYTGKHFKRNQGANLNLDQGKERN